MNQFEQAKAMMIDAALSCGWVKVLPLSGRTVIYIKDSDKKIWVSKHARKMSFKWKSMDPSMVMTMIDRSIFCYVVHHCAEPQDYDGHYE